MLTTLEHAIVLAALIWGVVELVRHLFPSANARLWADEQKYIGEIEDRVKALEDKLLNKQEQK